MKQIPNLFTLLNLVFGCLAIVATLQNGVLVYTTEQGQQIIELPEKLVMASLFIGLAGLVDFFDGFLARLLRSDSSMGKQLDSLADVVSFGVAPGIILYQFLRIAVAKDSDALDAPVIWLLPAFILPAAAAWRLAKFNLDESQQFYFKGLPTPSAGMVVASFPLIVWKDGNDLIIGLLSKKWALYAIIAVLSYLMVSNLPLMSLKFKNFTIKDNLAKFILLLVAVVAGIFLQWAAVPVVIIAYILLSLALKKQIV